VTAAISGGAGVLALLERVVRFRVGVLWYLLALLLLPAAGILSRLVAHRGLVHARNDDVSQAQHLPVMEQASQHGVQRQLGRERNPCLDERILSPL